MHKLALFIAWACVFQMIEFIFPNPFPGVRLGLANMITLVVLIQMGFAAALEVALVRVVISSILVGTFLSPTFTLSFFGALISTIFMGVAYTASKKQDFLRFSLLGISIIGAVTHTMTQLYLVYFLLIKHTGIFLLTPWLLISALIMGIITGIIARQICMDLDKTDLSIGRKEVRHLLHTSKIYQNNAPLPTSPLKYFSPKIKILYACFLALLVVFIENIYLYLLILIFTVILAKIARIPANKLWTGIYKMRFFLGITFILDLFFLKQGPVLLSLAGLQVTQTGITHGLLFILRLVILLLNSYIVTLSTTTESLAYHLSQLLSPLKFLGFSPKRFSKIMLMAWMLVPYLLERTFRYFKETITHVSALRHLSKSLSYLIVSSISPSKNIL